MFGMRDLKSLVKRAFDCGFIDSDVLGLDDFEEDLRQGIKHPDEPCPLDGHKYTLFGNTIDELSEWHCFTPQHREDRERWRIVAKGRFQFIADLPRETVAYLDELKERHGLSNRGQVLERLIELGRQVAEQ